MPALLTSYLSHFNMRMITVPAMSAFIGYITNVLTIKMIFHPRRQVGPRWLQLHGILPKRQKELATAVGHTVQKHLISTAEVQAILARPEIQQEIEALAKVRIGNFIEQKLKALNPMVAMFLTGTVKQKVEGILMDEIRALTPLMTEKMMARIESELDFQAIIEERVRAFDSGQLEAIIYEIAASELRAVEWLGGILGLVIGVIQVAILMV